MPHDAKKYSSENPFFNSDKRFPPTAENRARKALPNRHSSLTGCSSKKRETICAGTHHTAISLPSMPSIHHYNIPLQEFTLIHADRAFLVVNKPSGLLSVPGRGAEKQDCLIARVQKEYPDALIVHRLDCDTSGLLVLARSKETHRCLSMQFQDRQVNKRYIAVVKGKFEQTSGEVCLPLIVDWPNRPLHKVDFDTGKPSLTLYRVLNYDETEQCSRVELIPETGRTHQLRVHMQALGHPILGDSLYADPEAKAKADRLLLHAEYLSFAHPENGERLNFVCTAKF